MIGRLHVTLFFLSFCFLLVIIRLFYWQVIRAEELATMGKLQYGAIIKLSPQRGEIKTSDGFPIASSRLSYLAFANPKEVKEKEEAARLLSDILEVDEASISASLSLSRFWVPLKSGVPHKTKGEIDKLKLPGVSFEQEYKRMYPEASMAAHMIGFVGKNDDGEDTGYFGLEGYYDRQLKGKHEVAVRIQDALGRPILSKMNTTERQRDGRGLILTVDRSIQFIAEKKLKEGIERYQAAGGMVGIMDPKTGGILGMASFPSFDPLKYGEYSYQNYKNPFITNLFEPGSTFKTVVMAAGIDSGVVKPDTKCPSCGGPVSIGGYQIRTWNNKYRKDITMTEVIQYSDNTGMVFVAQSLGLERMFQYFKKFGIGELTGIDLQGEVVPEFRDVSQWYEIDVATAGFGQGIHITPIELLSAVSGIANNGVRMKPHVVAKVETEKGEVVTIPPEVSDKPISEKTARIMTEIMVNAVNKGEAKWTKVKGYRIAGKTGTAQIPIEGHYDPNKTIASFVGFAPANDPKFVMLVVVDRPTTSIYGSETAAPIFFNIAKDILTYYGIPPTEEE